MVDVAYNSIDHQYLVVWNADAYDGEATVGENEIWGLRLYGTNANPVEANEFRISNMGADGNANFDAERPTIVFNQYTNEFLVAWHGDNNSLIDEEFEIWGQRISFGGMPPAPTCNDGIQNGDETAIDCGGTTCAACVEPTCEDGIKNGGETGIDCGGMNCSDCPEPTCEDGVQNGDETGLDCGGANCPVCPILCDAPTGLSTNSVSATRATLKWNTVPEASNYTVEYRVMGTETWTSRSANKNKLGIKSLTASTTYEWRVRSNCEGGSSDWSETVTFTTSAAIDDIEQRSDDSQEEQILTVYPNPVNSLLQIEGLDHKVVSVITIHNLLGHLVLKESQATNQCSIQVQTFPKGIYLLTIVAGENTWQQKIIVH